MAESSAEITIGDINFNELDQIFITLENDLLEKDGIFEEELNSKVGEVISVAEIKVHKCKVCGKEYSTARGLTRHSLTKHAEEAS